MTPTPGQSSSKRYMAWFAAGLLIVIAFAVARQDVLTSPPYWDAAMGLYFEADFLARSDFDYSRLFHDEPRFVRGGAAVYLTSILPTFVAVLMKTLPNPPSVHLVYRLFTISCTVAILLIVFAWTRRRSGAFAAVLVVFALASTPPFLTQAELLGMEMPLTLVALIAASFACQQRFIAAALASLATVFIKANGILVIAATGVFIAVRTALFWREMDWPARRKHLIGLGACAVVHIGEVMLSRWVHSLPQQEELTSLFDLRESIHRLADVASWCPDVAALVALAAVISVVHLCFGMTRPSLRGLLASFRETLSGQPILVYSWILVSGIIASHAITYAIPRYLVFPIAFIYLGLGQMLFANASVRLASSVALLLVILLNGINVNGALYPPLPEGDVRTGAYRERSHEYLADHRSNIRAVQAIVDQGGDVPVIACNPFVHFLSLPSLGYVDVPLKGWTVNEVILPSFPSVLVLREENIDEAQIVSVDNRFSRQGSAMLLPPEKEEQVLYDDAESFPRSPLTVYVTPRQEGDRFERRQRLIDRLWPWLQAVAAVDQKSRAGDVNGAIETLEKNSPPYPQDAEIRIKRAEILERAGRLREAIDWYQSVPMVPRHRARSMDRLARLLERSGQPQAAEQAIRQAEDARHFFRETTPPERTPRAPAHD